MSPSWVFYSIPFYSATAAAATLPCPVLLTEINGTADGASTRYCVVGSLAKEVSRYNKVCSYAHGSARI